VSAAGGARLALVPSSPADASALPPFDSLVRSSAAKRASSARARRLVSGMWVTGCSALVAGTLLMPVYGEAAVAATAIAGLLLLPVSGIVLFSFALLDRTREALTAFVAAAVLLVATVALLKPAHRAGVEIHFAANHAELDAFAAEILAVAAAAPRDPGRIPDARARPESNERLRRLGFRSVVRIEGGLLFNRAEGPRYALLYVDGAAFPAERCLDRPPRFLGGRWYEVRCPNEAAFNG
jgi:hypothetical protein